jgi:tRNA pseudouridine38-40 synthase
VAYDGRNYHGWQRQTNALTIQQILEETIEKIIQSPITLFASGRTDAGVHALGQACNFKTNSQLNLMALKSGLNALLPEDILVKEAVDVPLDFHSRYAAKSKVYEYRILNRKAPDLFRRHYVWHIGRPLRVDEMRRCLSAIRGEHDFSSFQSSGSRCVHAVRRVFGAELIGEQDGLLRLVIEADGFLRHMVRNIVGTLTDAGLGKIDAGRFHEILHSKDRSLAGVKAPAHGLYLVKVHYAF